MYNVTFTRSAQKGVEALKQAKKTRELLTLHLLVQAIIADGPMRPEFKNFSKLSTNCYHCHLSYRYVACWRDLGSNHVEVYYVGSREGAPY